MAGQSTALPKRSDDPYKAILGVGLSTPAPNVDPYAQIFAAPAPDNSAAQWMGVVNNALAPYAAAAGAGALAGLPAAGVGAAPGAAAGVLSLGLTDLGTSAYNLVGGGVFGAPRVSTGSEVIRNALRPTGMLREPQTTAQRVVGAGLEGAAGAGSQANALTNLASQFGPRTANFMRTMGQGPGQQAAIGAGGVAAPVLAQEYGVTDPTTLMLTSLAGGVAGGKGAVALQGAGRTVQNAAARAIEAATGRGPRTQAQISAAFENATNSGLRYNADAYTTFVNEAETALRQRGYNPTLSSSQQPITEIFDVMRQSPAGVNLSIEDLHTLRQNIGLVRNSPNRDIRRMAGMLTDRLDSFISSPNALSVTGLQAPAEVQQTFRNAVRDQNLQFKSQEITRLVDRAQLMQGDMAANLRSQFAAVARNPTRMRRFTPAEQATITKIAQSKGTIGSLIGRLAPGTGPRNIVADMIHGLIGTGAVVATQNPYALAVGGATAAVAGGANAARNAMATQAARDLAAQVRRGTVRMPPQYGRLQSISPLTQAAVGGASKRPSP